MEEWQNFANCKGMPVNKFFDDYEDSIEVQLEVDQICANCIVRQQCLEWALAEGLSGGVFGRKYLTHTNKKKRKKSGVSKEAVGSS